ncbi:MAG: DNA repair protein RecN [Treponema sp.]|jgi:DNA repair protein RecN (Recombination protein N)|nr:DNA repair protein RecN [Treponema sp.]
MLEELSVRNYALIDSITLSFRKGFNVLTGETGAGKSIIVGSLGFLMGAKAEIDVIRTGCEDASVSAVISVNKNRNEVREWLKGRDIISEEETVIIRRTIKNTGRGSIFIQNIPVTRQDLADFMSLLFDIHGQHNHESLLRKESHRRYLDKFAVIEDEVSDFYRMFLELTEKRKTLEASLQNDRDREERLELLKYSVDEITNADIRAGEIREAENEAQRLSDFEKLAGLAQTVCDSFNDAEPSALSLIRRAKNALDSAAATDNSLAQTQKRLDDLFYEARDLAEVLRSYRENLTFDPVRLEEVNERLALLYKLKKKYVKSADTQSVEEAVLSYKTKSEFEIDALLNAGENRDKIKAEITLIEKEIIVKAQSIRKKRTAAAGKLGDSIRSILKNLGMPNAGFKAEIIPKENGQIGPWGAEDVEFLISANKGEPLKELARIASGGELSRIMLAIKTILLSEGNIKINDNIETLIFDEIDTGIGGEVALSVGEYLAKIGKIRQIFCVTHLASIAVRADNHFKVEKKIEEGRTYTGIGPLSAEGRRNEIARMLAGDAGEAALAHADELIIKYGAVNGKDQ